MSTDVWIYPTDSLSPSYVIGHRIMGYDVNDGRWTAERVAPTSWTRYGCLQTHGSGRFLGVFDTRAEAEAAVAADGPVWAAESHTPRMVR